MNKQEIYNTVAEHLLTQLEKSKGDRQCLYRGPNNTKCALGCLIPDDMYSKDLEGDNIYFLPNKVVEYLLPDDIERYSESVEFLRELEKIHDFREVLDWRTALIEFAYLYDLDVPQIVDPQVIFIDLTKDNS